MKTLTRKEVYTRDNIHIYEYVLSPGVRMLEFGAFFLFVIAVSVYPFTHFDPKIWMIAPIILSIGGIAALSVAQYWRSFAKKAYIAYDDAFLIVGYRPEKALCIPWEKLNVQSAGLSDEKAGMDLRMQIDEEIVHLRLFTNFVCIPDFQNVLCTILTHVRENEQKAKSPSPKKKEKHA